MWALLLIGAAVIVVLVLLNSGGDSKAPSRVHWDDQLAKESVRPRPQPQAQAPAPPSPQDIVKAKFQQAFRYYVEQGMDPEEAKEAAMNQIRPKPRPQPQPEPEGDEMVSLKDDGKVSEDQVKDFWERRNRHMERVAAMNGHAQAPAPPQPAGAPDNVDSSVYLLKAFA